MATTRKLLGMKSGPLTKRDAWAATFEHVFTLTEPRTDCPLHLPAAAKPFTEADLEKELELPVNGLQEDLMYFLSGLVDVEYPKHITKQREVGPWVEHHYNLHVERMRK